MPNIFFTGDSNKWFKRFYTRYFPNSTSAALDIACYSLGNQKKWLEAIANWRRPILFNKLETNIGVKNNYFQI
jgi:hypothetical protein